MDITSHDTPIPIIGPKSSCNNPNLTLIIKKSCFFFLSFIILILLLLGFTSFVVFVVVKPRKPLFTVQKADLEFYKLDVLQSNKALLLSSLLSFTLNASNPNRFVGVSYGSSRLHVLENGTVIGMIKVPGFHQPPRTKNISVQGQVILQCLNVNQIIDAPAAGNLIQGHNHNDDDDDEMFQLMRILGDVGVQVRVFRINLPKLRVALDCGIRVDQKHLTFNFKMRRMKAAMMSTDHMTWFKYLSLPTVSQLFSKKCSYAVYI